MYFLFSNSHSSYYFLQLSFSFYFYTLLFWSFSTFSFVFFFCVCFLLNSFNFYSYFDIFVFCRLKVVFLFSGQRTWSAFLIRSATLQTNKQKIGTNILPKQKIPKINQNNAFQKKNQVMYHLTEDNIMI